MTENTPTFWAIAPGERIVQTGPLQQPEDGNGLAFVLCLDSPERIIPKATPDGYTGSLYPHREVAVAALVSRLSSEAEKHKRLHTVLTNKLLELSPPPPEPAYPVPLPVVPDFKEFPKLSRLSRQCVVTEKLDGTNSQILITEDGDLFTGSRNRWITPADDNFGFAKWAQGHRQELLQLGPGRHFGEWWGAGIQRTYGLRNNDKRWSLFNVQRWCLHNAEPKVIPHADTRVVKMQDRLPECCGLVPVLYEGLFLTSAIERALSDLRLLGSYAAPGFMQPEGVVVFHVAGNVGFKKTCYHDDEHKGQQKAGRDNTPTGERDEGSA